jgi:cupin superfamily acireductone dioxygenase involved in methionine salvage
MRVYYHDGVDTDGRLPHEGAPIDVSALEELNVFASNIQDRAEVDRIAAEKGYKHRDEVRHCRRETSVC